MSEIKTSKRVRESSSTITIKSASISASPSESLELWALTSPEILEAIDRAEAQIVQGTMSPIDDVLAELGINE
jgi:hypothetical protein